MNYEHARQIALLLALTASVSAQAHGDTTHRPVQRIYGGTVTPTCAWPQTVLMDLTDALCTGTLVHPQVVVYASHCGTDVQAIGFGEDLTVSSARIVKPEYCRLYPGHAPENGTDFAYCKLTMPITDVPIVPILMGCEVNALEPNKQVVLVGYGEDVAGDVGIKHAVTTMQHRIVTNKAFVGGNGHDTCNGDSGGPAFVQLTSSDNITGLADDTWRVYGVTSYGTTTACGDGSYDSLLANAVPWIESDSGLDITPCTDAFGHWSPGPQCGAFPLHPDGIDSAWSSGCATSAVSGVSATCGPPYGYQGPSLSIVSPSGGTPLSPNDRFWVTVNAVGDTSHTHLMVRVGNTSLPPSSQSGTSYQFGPFTAASATFPIVATATDSDGLVAGSQVQVHIDMVGGCSSVPTPLFSALFVAYLLLRRRPRQLSSVACLVALLGMTAACGKQRLDVLPRNLTFDPNAELTTSPVVINSLHGSVGTVAMTPASAQYLYGNTTLSGTDVTVLAVVLGNEPNYCTLIQSNSDSATAIYYLFEVFDTQADGVIPTDGTFTVVDPNRLPSKPGRYATGYFQANDAGCSNRLSSSQSVATSGSVTVKTLITPSGAYVSGSFANVVFGSQHDTVSGQFTALGCTIPETAPAQSTCEP